MFLLNSRIPLVRFSSESIVAGVRILSYPGSQFETLVWPKFLQSSPFNARTYNPILRANPFPEVTDLICRIPLSTLFYRPEAANLGDLMRLWVRPGVFGEPHSDFQGPLWASLTIRRWTALPIVYPLLWIIHSGR